VRESLAAAPLPVSDAGRVVLRSGERDLIARYMLWHGVGPADGVLSPSVCSAVDPLEEWRAEFRARLAGQDPFRQLQRLELNTRLVDFINFEVDRMSMAHSIEARVPFLDHELWEFVAALPSAWLSDGSQPKGLLRAAMREHLPAEILNRRKWGLAAPHADWLRRPRLPDWAEEALLPSALAASGYFDAQVVKRLRAEHQSGRRNHARVLMGVLSTMVWHRQFIDRR
jgi:asparagine synthase (glutamine-hydrolysing)